MKWILFYWVFATGDPTLHYVDANDYHTREACEAAVAGKASIDFKKIKINQTNPLYSTVEDRKSEAVTVLHHLERNQVTAVSVNL